MSSNSIIAALSANFAIAVSKSVGAFFTGSASMVAESIHSFADCGNQLLLILGQKLSNKPASSTHPLGHGREIYFWSFIVALILFLLGGTYSIYEGIHKIMHPEPIQYVQWATAILIGSAILEFFSLKTCISEIKEKNDISSGWINFIKETRHSELLVILCEDFAALCGLLIAGVMLLLSWITGNSFFDAIGSVLVGVTLVCVATILSFETKKLLIGESVDPTLRKNLLQLISEFDGIEHTYELVTHQLGSNSCMLLMRVRFNSSNVETLQDCVDIINRLETKIVAEFPEFTKIFIEPDTNFKDFL